MNKWAVTAATGTSLAGSSAGAYALGAFDGFLSSSSTVEPIIQDIDKKNGCVQKTFSNINIGLIKNEETASNSTTSTLAFIASTPVTSCLLAVVNKTEPSSEEQPWEVHSFLWSLKRGENDGFVARFTIDKSNNKSYSTLYLLNKPANKSWAITKKETQVNDNVSTFPQFNSSLMGGGISQNNSPTSTYNTIYVEWTANNNENSYLKNWSSNFDSWVSTLFSEQAYNVIDSTTANAYKGSWKATTMPS